MTVGTGGGGAGDDATGGTGNDTWFSTSGTILAKGGNGGTPAGSGGSGGAAGSGIGDVTTSGGNGGAGAATAGGGGGGSGGSLASGSNGSGTAAGNIGAVIGGAGGAGGTTAAGNPGKAVAGGGGGTGASGANGAAGANGMVRLTYTTVSPPSDSTDLISRNTSVLYGDESVDDADYSIQYGSEYLLSNYQKININNTDIPSFTWKGRTTYDTRISPILIQIYNVNSSAWETLANVNSLPADTDTSVTVTQTSNVSNYYSTDNTVIFRIYQQVV